MPSPDDRAIASRSRFGAVAVLVALAVALTGCGSSGDDSKPSAAEAVQARAQAGLLQSYTATYAIDEGGKSRGTVTVARTPSSLRLDVKTATGTSTSITTPERTIACQQPASGAKATCLVVAGPGKTPPAAFDPMLRKVFGDVLRVLASDDGTSGATVAETANTATVPPSMGAVTCFNVSGKPKSPVAVGTYCFNDAGVPVAVTFPSGTATLTEFSATAPGAAKFEPAASPTPLPSTAS